MNIILLVSAIEKQPEYSFVGCAPRTSTLHENIRVRNAHPTTTERLGVHKHSLYEWVRQAKTGQPVKLAAAESSDAAELRRLRAELKRVTEERDILKKAAAYFAKG